MELPDEPMVVLKTKTGEIFFLQFLHEKGGLRYAVWMSPLNSDSLESSSEANITQQVFMAEIWWHAKKSSYLMIRVYDPCDHSH